MKTLRIFALLATVLIALPAVADDVTVQNVLYHQYQQTTNSPCVIGESSCNNPAGFSYTLGTSAGPASSYDLYSPVYTVGQITTLLSSNSFFVGYDANNTNDAQGLVTFEVIINGVVVYSLPSTFTATAPFNGTGYADWLLAGPNGLAFSLAGLNATDTVQFHAVVNPANDGGEQFFLIAGGGNVEVPEPASLFLMGTGLIGFGSAVRKRFKK